ncbi:MAG TPA: RagB/SusD family nutrient uptake outer membrane protein [Puia sp.]|jgi:tetratricopeptide (TPR) repeat protein|nr:RagB/SusD family nutrient uptake outer membrane protein [Puia sp.]
MKLPSFIRTLILLLVAGLAVVGCRKAFLAQKPSSDLLVPNSLNVLQELLDNTQVMNISPALGEVSADNYFLLYTTWAALDTKESNAYIWAPDLYDGQGLVSDWDIPYQQVFYANTVLQGLAGIQPDSTDQAEWNMLEGWALFSRAFAFYNITQLFAEPYDSATTATDPGIPIRLTADINEKTTRATMQASYAQILSDLSMAEGLLPAAIPVNNLNRPSKLAVQALFARIYLSVGDYTDAGKYADTVLAADPALMDYNSPEISGVLPFLKNMPEIIYQSNFPQPGNGNILEGLIYPGCRVDSNLIASYDSNDLRRSAYYFQEGKTIDSFTIKGSYSGTIFPFSGLATDELYLIRAECYARAGNTGNAINDLNSLLMHRWKTGTFTGYPINNAPEALDTILVERRKELAFRGLRWSDLRRLNREGRDITLTRNLNGQTYSLLFPSDSSLYTLPIPPDVIQFSHIQQNPR